MTVPHLRVRAVAPVGPLELSVELDTGPGTLVLIGPNGAGKTSLLSLLLGILSSVSGRIEVGDQVLFDSELHVHVPLEQRRLGYVPQDYALFPHLTVRENVAFAVRSTATRASEASRRVETALRDLEISALADRRPRELSGGEKQRVALARALSVSPRALLLDEPLAALDVHARREVRSFLARTLSTLSLPTIVVTHDPEDARLLGQRIAALESGRITQFGTWEELAAAPATRFVEEFVTVPRP